MRDAVFSHSHHKGVNLHLPSTIQRGPIRQNLWVMTYVALLRFLSFSPEAATVQWFISEGDADKPVPCHVYLWNDQQKPIQVPWLPFWKNHFATHGEFEIELPAGDYTFEIHRGPEYRRIQGFMKVGEEDDILRQHHRLERLVDLAEEGWISGELHIHRPLGEVPLLIQASDLHVGPVISWWNQRNPWKEQQKPEYLWKEVAPKRFSFLMGGEDERRGGALLFFDLERPLLIQEAAPEYPSSLNNLEMAKKQGAWVDMEKPFWWDAPLWLASEKVDSVGLANNHLWERGMLDNEAWGRARPKEDYPSVKGNGEWSQFLYHQILNAGFQLAPSAGSASGVLNNPVGYNRVYVHLEADWKVSDWWEGLRQGQCFVSNGPLLRCWVEKKPGSHEASEPTHPFWPGSRLPVKNRQEMILKARLTSQDPVEAFELIHNGEVVRKVAVDPQLNEQDLGPAPMDQPGWYVV